jgi:hypothetical protein
MIGLKGEAGENRFDFSVCTPRWLQEALADGTVLLGSHYLFVDHYVYEWIWGAIERRCNLANGSSWIEVANQLKKYGRWEFDDY